MTGAKFCSIEDLKQKKYTDYFNHNKEDYSMVSKIVKRFNGISIEFYLALFSDMR